MADELEYLHPDFDLNSLTVPRLRSILVSHDIPYPASAKKAQLIGILEDEVLPQARKLLRDRDTVRRTSMGITDMSSRSTSVASDANDRESMPPPATPSTVGSTSRGQRGTSRRSTRHSTADADDAFGPATPVRNTKRTSVARSVGKHARTSDTETGDDTLLTPVAAIRPTPRKSTAKKVGRSEILPSTEVDEHTPSVKSELRHETTFTDDNPFQSGSPEAPKSARMSYDSRRKSASRLSTDSPARGRGLRSRKSATPSSVQLDDGFQPPHRESFDFASRLMPPQEESGEESEESEEDEESEIGTGEEFTPEEQLAMSMEDDQYSPKVQTRRRSQKQGTLSRLAPWVVILSLAGSFGAWWRKEKLEIGYCGLGKPTWSLADTRVPDWANVLEPRCEPCPSHAFCYPNFEVRCENDFLLKPHPLALGGLVPLPPTCEPDSEKERRVKAVADKAVEELRERRAKWECGQLKEDGKGARSPDISEPELREEVAKKRRKGLSDAEFDELWKGAIGEILGKDEVISKPQKNSSILVLSSTSIARLPLACAVRRHFRLALLAYRLPISLLIMAIGLLVYARARVLARRSDIARVPELVATTLDRLSTQAALYARGDAKEPYIAIGQLRDDVLRFELQGKRREELWRRVRNFVEGNANVRASVREGRSGDVSRVWEWIGGINAVGEPEHTSRRESARFSIPSPSSNIMTSPHTPAGESQPEPLSSPRESRRWDEGRPIY
ncbi:Inner nuclear membrane protein MAN1 [Penicillium robsamsonii]|uniref:Inner nuclear membrane protein MAN1 n=1 Tax=Penicillium robsamsonii TaxID=1792511 RepID=UPI0025474F97|nr:Inner nuclear membrane protein MAN1 [Penicillium robsamsonii]KAJ5835543.1 Inner nuclear membrane protein MAN1 [Penicillium robsamsonii]